MITSLEQRKIKIKPRAKLNHNIYIHVQEVLVSRALTAKKGFLFAQISPYFTSLDFLKAYFQFLLISRLLCSLLLASQSSLNFDVLAVALW